MFEEVGKPCSNRITGASVAPGFAIENVQVVNANRFVMNRVLRTYFGIDGNHCLFSATLMIPASSLSIYWLENVR